MRLNQRGSALLNVIVASLVIGGMSAVIMQQASQSQGYSRLARVKSSMFAAETQMRSLVLEPSSYTGCNGTDFRTCQFNAPLITNFRMAVSGAKCAAGTSGGCGVVIRARPGVPLFNSATRAFNAAIHYEGEELALRDIEIQNLIVPHETLQQSAAICPAATPLFRGMQDGQPICESLNSLCGPRQWATNINPNTLAITCADYPPSISCAPTEYISNISYTAAGLTASCAPRADIWAFNRFTPSINESTNVIRAAPPKPAPTNPGLQRVDRFISVNSDCYPTLAQCESAAGAGNCSTSATSVFRATGGSGGGVYLNKKCDINYPGSLREKPCSPTGSTTYVWDACIYDGYGKVDWDQPYLSTNYECRVQQYCPIAVPTTTTAAPTCVYSCTSGNAECSPGPAAGCSYASYRTATGQPNRVGQSCSSRFNFQRTGGGVTCDIGWVDCDCTATATTTTTLPPPTTPPPPPPTSPPSGGCATGVNTAGNPTVRWIIVCAANNGNNGSPRPDFNALKAGTPAGGTRSFSNFGASGSNSGWNCLASNAGNGNIQVSGNRSSYLTYGYVYGEVDWGGTVYSGWSGEQTSNADQCDMRGNGGRWGDCTLGVGGSLPEGLAVGQMVNMPSTVHGYFSAYTCSPPSGTMCTTCASQCPGGAPAGSSGQGCRCGDGSYQYCL